MPAAELAEEGLLVDWYAALLIASATRMLAANPTAAATFLEEGRWPTISSWTALQQKRVDLSRHGRDSPPHRRAGAARVLRRRARARHRPRREQAPAAASPREDLRGYRAVLEEPHAIPYRGGAIHVAPELTAGPTLAHCLSLLAEAPLSGGRQPDAAAYLAYARALAEGYRWRLANMGDVDAEGARTGPACTTHFNVVDRHGNICAVTQTLLSIFGSKVMLPESGLLMNNGILWFDPEPGKPNSMEPGKRCLMNVCPVIGEHGGRRFALGASGGRRIMPAVMQLVSFLVDYGMSLEEAFHHPRIDLSGGDAAIADETLPAAVHAALAAHFKLVPGRRTVFPYLFACPAGVLREGELNVGATEIMSPWGDAVAEDGGGR